MSHEYRPIWKAERGYFDLQKAEWLSDEECDRIENLKREHRTSLSLSLPRTEDAWRRAFGLIPEEPKRKIDKDEVRERVDMLDLVTKNGAKMRSFGRRASGTCPFHEDRLSSFSVDLDRKLWNCFAGCGGGDCFSFVMRLEECTFYESVKILNSEY